MRVNAVIFWFIICIYKKKHICSSVKFRVVKNISKQSTNEVIPVKNERSPMQQRAPQSHSGVDNNVLHTYSNTRLNITCNPYLLFHLLSCLSCQLKPLWSRTKFRPLRAHCKQAPCDGMGGHYEVYGRNNSVDNRS